MKLARPDGAPVPRCSIMQRTVRRSDPKTSRSAATFWGSPRSGVEKILGPPCDRARFAGASGTSTPGFASCVVRDAGGWIPAPSFWESSWARR